jgi:hypothetical protein
VARIAFFGTRCSGEVTGGLDQKTADSIFLMNICREVTRKTLRTLVPVRVINFGQSEFVGIGDSVIIVLLAVTTREIKKSNHH